jgi:hypothetical protein
LREAESADLSSREGRKGRIVVERNCGGLGGPRSLI